MERKPRILVVGSFMMNLTAAAERVPDMGETVIGLSFSTAPGGKGANQAVQCARLGADVSMAGCVGADSFGREMLDAVSASGVDTSHVKISGEHASGVGNIQLQVTRSGTENRILVVPGANYDLTPEDLLWMREGVRAYDFLLLQLELRMDVTGYAAECARAAGVPVMLNPAPAAPLDAGLLSCVTYVSPNEHEAGILTGSPLRPGPPDAPSVSRTAEAIRSLGAGSVLITLGENGSFLTGPGGSIPMPCVPAPAVLDPTAAGDSFIGAFCTGLASGLSERDALALASHAAAITVSRRGAMPSLPTLEEVVALMEQRGAAPLPPQALERLRPRS